MCIAEVKWRGGREGGGARPVLGHLILCLADENEIYNPGGYRCHSRHLMRNGTHRGVYCAFKQVHDFPWRGTVYDRHSQI